MPINKAVIDFNGNEHPYGNLGAELGSAPSGYGADYDQMFAANPYRNQTYKKSFWQALAEGLGFRTGYDTWRESAMNNAAEWDADVFALMNQNQYDSPAAMASRERAGGMNPDLLGVGDVAQSAGMRNDANGMQPTESDIPIASSILSSVSRGVMDIIPNVMSFITNITDLKGRRIQNDKAELSFANDAMGAAEKFFLEGITELDYKEAFEKNDWTNILDAASKDAKYLSSTYLANKRAQRRFNLAYGMHSRSLAAKMSKYKTYDEFEKARKSLLTQRASQFFSDDDDTMMSLIQSINGPLERYQKRMNVILETRAGLRNPSLEQSLENKQLSNQFEYENSIDPSMQAAAENAANERTSQENEIITATNDLFADIMSALGERDNWWTAIAKTIVGVMRAQVLSGMHMQFGRSQQYEVDGDSGVFTESGRSNMGFSF